MSTNLAARAMIKDESFWPLRKEILYGTGGASPNAEPAHRALVQVDSGEIVFDGRRVKRADLRTDTAGDASDLAILFCINPFVFRMAGYEDLFRCREDFDDFCRACLFTLSAAGTFRDVNEGDVIVSHGYSAKRADPRTGTVAETSVSACLVATDENNSTAILYPLIGKLFY